MRRIATINQKGGVGKTTTAVNVGAALAEAGHRVMLIDLDPQAHLTLHLGLDPAADRPGMYSMLTRSMPISEARHAVRDNLWIVPSHIDLAAVEVELLSMVGREMILRDALNADSEEFDFVIIDCPPSLGVLTLNALAAAGEVLIPLQPHVLALQGMGKLLETISLVSRRINPDLVVSGVVLCMNEHGTRLAAEVIEDLRGFLEESRGTKCPWSEARVFTSSIRRNIKLAECPGYGQSIFEYAPRSRGALDYAAFARELADPDAVLDAVEPATVPAQAEPVVIDETPAVPLVLVKPEPSVVASPRVEDTEEDGIDPEPDVESEPVATLTLTPDFGPIAAMTPAARPRWSHRSEPSRSSFDRPPWPEDLQPWGEWSYAAFSETGSDEPVAAVFAEVVAAAQQADAVAEAMPLTFEIKPSVARWPDPSMSDRNGVVHEPPAMPMAG